METTIFEIIFVTLLRTPLLQQMTTKNLDNVHTIRNSRRHTFPFGTKTTLVFLHPKKPFWLPLPTSTSLVSRSTFQTKNTYSCILKVTGQVWKSQKGLASTFQSCFWLISLPSKIQDVRKSGYQTWLFW